MNNVKKLDSSISENELRGLRNVPLKPIKEMRIEEDENLATTVEGGIPQFNLIELDNIAGEYTLKDGALVFHIYKKDRKALYDKIMADVENTRRGSKEESEVFKNGNLDMQKIPWWDNTEQVLAEEAKNHFKYLDNRIGYAQEVDSWTVMFPEPTTPGATSDMYLRGFLGRVDIRLGAK